jgi:hypothetical protein
MPARAMAIIARGVKSILLALGQDAEHVPHWMQRFIFSPPGMDEISWMKSLLPCSFISIAHLPSANYTSFKILNKMIRWSIFAYFLDLGYGIIYNRGIRYGIGR